jgi:iron complex outermembrane receptor protein
MEGVEVLRSPQGLFGVTRASARSRSIPLGQFNGVSGEVSGEVGTGDRYKLTGILNVPVSEHAAFRFAGSQQWFNGYWHNKLDGRQVGAQ